MAQNNIGYVRQVIGPTMDVEFDSDHLPNILNAITIDDPERDIHVVAEVALHIGDNLVRCVAMHSTDGLVRGMEAVNTGDMITVPVGEQVLGHIFNLTGDALDERGELPHPELRWPIHRAAPSCEEQMPAEEVLVTGVKVIDLIAPFTRGGKTGPGSRCYSLGADLLVHAGRP